MFYEYIAYAEPEFEGFNQIPPESKKIQRVTFGTSDFQAKSFPEAFRRNTKFSNGVSNNLVLSKYIAYDELNSEGFIRNRVLSKEIQRK